MLDKAERRRIGVVACVSVILVLQIAVAYALSTSEQPPAMPALRTMPVEIGPWKLANEEVMQPDVAALLRPDDYIDWTYVASEQARQVNLTVAYFKSPKGGYGPHSPRDCLPGSGWMPRQFSVIRAPVPGGNIPLNQYVLEKENKSLLAMYWYQNQSDVWAEEFWIKVYRLPQLLRYRRSDVALVRIMMPLDNNTVEAAKGDLLEFIRVVFPLMVDRFSSAR